MKNENKIKRETPIQDGDTRPDQNIDGKPAKDAGSPVASKKQKITKERGADVNSLEDFKDAKEA
jgi:hypothetical protein